MSTRSRRQLTPVDYSALNKGVATLGVPQAKTAKRCSAKTTKKVGEVQGAKKVDEVQGGDHRLLGGGDESALTSDAGEGESCDEGSFAQHGGVSDIKQQGSDTQFAYVGLLNLSGQSSYEELGGYQAIVAPGGQVIVWEENSADLKEISKKLLLSGFVDICTVDSSQGGVMLQCKTPNYSRGATATLKLTNNAAQNTKWTIDLNEDEDDELIDDEELLTEEDKQKTVAPSKGSGCGSKSACKNCVCGRAEGKAPTKLTKSMVENPQSGCGSCGLGDAFRCAGCPYRGLPQFEMGKKIELPSGFLVADD